MNIILIVNGKYKESFYKEAEQEYVKRLTPYAKIRILELPEEPFRDISEKEKIQKKEAENMEKHLPKDAHIFLLHETGKEMDSIIFSDLLKTKGTKGEKIVFVLGGPLGFHAEFLKKYPAHISLSHFTFPHQMARLILVEQLYRAGTILHEKQYHY